MSDYATTYVMHKSAWVLRTKYTVSERESVTSVVIVIERANRPVYEGSAQKS